MAQTIHSITPVAAPPVAVTVDERGSVDELTQEEKAVAGERAIFQYGLLVAAVAAMVIVVIGLACWGLVRLVT